MAASVDFYTVSAFVDRIGLGAFSTEAPGFDKENVLDFNPNIYWKPTGTADQHCYFDFGFPVTIDAVYFWVNNYTSLVDSEAITVHSSTDDITYDFRLSTTPITNQQSPVRYGSWTGVSARYWRISFINLTTIPQISMIQFGNKYSLSTGNQYPEDDAYTFNNKYSQTFGGRQFARVSNNRQVEKFSRTYLINGTAEWEELRTAHLRSRGGAYPLVVQEGSSFSDAKLVWFTHDDLPKIEIDYLSYNPTCEFKEVPFVRPGYNY